MIWQLTLVFGATFVLDFAFARYTRAVTEQRALHAAHYAALIIVLGAVGIIAYTTNPWLLIASASGAWAGTYFSMRLDASAADAPAPESSYPTDTL